MPNVRKLQVSFSGGEVSGEFYGRSDDPKFQTGAATMRNMIPLPHGPVQSRAGFAYVREVKDSSKVTRLLPFTFSTTQTMVIEMGAGYFRFHTAGATLLSPTPAAYNGATQYDVGDMVLSGGVKYYCISLTTGNAPPNATYWYAMPSSGEYEIPNPYAEADLFDIHYVQSADVLTLVHPGHRPMELRRLGATQWTIVPIAFAAPVPPPGYTSRVAAPINHTYKITATASFPIPMFSLTRDYRMEPSAAISASNDLTIDGAYNRITWTNAANIVKCDVYKLVGSTYYYLGTTSGASFIDDGSLTPNTSAPQPAGSLPTGISNLSISTTSAGGTVSATATGSGATTYTYVVTSVSPDGKQESIASASASCVNNLLTTGNYNTITWAAVPGVRLYNVYKESNGLFGFIGQSGKPSLVDDNIAADISKTPPIHQDPFATPGNYPAAVSYFEQRRCFAGTTNSPQSVWLTKPGSESDLAYSVPSSEDDAIAFRVAAREANTIRHLVPLNDLVALTSAAEWRITSINADALTPSTVSVRPQSYVGANNAQPFVVNNTLIYAAARGGHIRELAYNWQAGGFLTGDLSLRATHLFDTYDITEMVYAKSPYPVGWFVRNDGRLLGLTYVPEQQVGAWHWHDTDGSFESIATVAEGGEDVLYAIIQRTVGGNVVRYVERMATRLFDAPEDAFFVDAGATFDGNNTTATTMTVSGGASWGSDETLTLTASAAAFVFPVTTDVGDQVVLEDADGNVYKLTVESTSSTTVATVRTDKTLPVSLRNTALASWAWARDSISGLGHLEGCTVNILADGAVHPQRTVVSGAITLDQPSIKVHVGLPINADLQTLPLSVALRDGSNGQGRQKNINRAWLRVYRSSGIFVGPSAQELVEAKQRTDEPYGAPPDLKSEEIEVVVRPGWDDDGQVYVRQSDPLPLTILALTLEAALGG